MQLEDFRLKYKRLVHYTPTSDLRIDKGLLTVTQKLDLNADAEGRVRARFRGDAAYQEYDADFWKSHPRFKPGAREADSNVFVQDRDDAERAYFLGNNHSFGDGSCLGTTIELTDNMQYDAPMKGEDWLRLLNRMFWVFIEGNETKGYVEQVRNASPDRRVSKITLTVARLPDDLLEGPMRLSAINGGAVSGYAKRGTATYKPLANWGGKKPAEIGIMDGVTAEAVARLRRDKALVVEEA